MAQNKTVRATDKVSFVNDEAELKERGYVVGIRLGEGSYAKVFSVFSEKLGKKVAVKIINQKKAPKDFLQKFLPRELEIMRTLKHQNIIELYDVFSFGYKLCVVMELAGHGNLLEFVQLRGAMTEPKAAFMFQQLASAVAHMHEHNVVHRDLKCDNILLDSANNPKVADFGFSRFVHAGDLSKTYCGSAAYAAPEVLQGIPYQGQAYDVWSLGVILYIMVCGVMPYDDSNVKRMIKMQTERKVGFPSSKTLSDECKRLIHAMLECDVTKRVTMQDVLRHAWLTTNLATYEAQDKAKKKDHQASTSKSDVKIKQSGVTPEATATVPPAAGTSPDSHQQPDASPTPGHGHDQVHTPTARNQSHVKDAAKVKDGKEGGAGKAGPLPLADTKSAAKPA